MANVGPAAGRAAPIKDGSAGPMGQPGMDPKENLATFIYDYFLKHGKVDLANAMLSSTDLGVRTRPRIGKKSPGGVANGVDDPMDMEHKDELMKKIESLPEADIQEQLPRDSFLEDWWGVFWDIWAAGRLRKTSSGLATQYMQHNNYNRNLVTQRMLHQQQQALNGIRGGMNPNMARMNPNDMRSLAMQNRQGMNQMTRNISNLTPQQQAQLQSDMGNQQQPQSPMSTDAAPSPKRPRVGEAPFSTPQMNPGAQNRPVSMPMPTGPVQQPGMMAGNMDMANGPFGMGGGTPQRFGEMNIFAGDPIRMGNGNQQGGALADYQMQLMLLEQQNKKRLLMARQEQEVTSQGGGAPGATAALMGPGGAGAGPPFQAGLSPRRGGQSPSPNDPTKRANSSMGQASPRPDGQMPMTRGSPAPGAFDPSQMASGMAGQFPFNPNQMGPNGMRPGGPGFQGQGGAPTMEQIRAARGQMPPNWPVHPGVQPGNMVPGLQQGPNSQQQNPMPPPSAPNAGPNAGRTNPSSPAPGANPPTPQQNKNANAKGGKKDAPKDNKKAKSGKKAPNNTGATPSSEVEANGPPTPTPPTPITPSAPNNPFKNGQPGGNVPGPNNGQPPQPQMPNMPGSQDPNAMNANNPFGQLHESNEVDFPSFDLSGGDANDVLEGFDFDSFLNTDNHDGGFGFDTGFGMNGDGVEMGARDA